MTLEEVLERDFGAAWRLDPPLGESAVAAFEAQHDVGIPEPYRTFVASVANGAAGPPHYGLVRMGEPADRSGAHAIVRGSLREPFPLTDHWVWEGESPTPDEAKVTAVHEFGILPLGSDGDGMDYVLVVTGEARGQVWMVTDAGAFPVAADFGKWIEGDLLPEAEWTLDNRRGAADVPGAD